ncbi:MAG: GntR family transcriptional regulator [Desulfopila sp.]
MPEDTVDDETIDKTSHLPAYAQLANILRMKISSGHYEPGSRLPSEPNLSRKYALSVMTTRQAVGVLVEEGLVKRIQGKGTFVQRIGVVTSNFELEVFQKVFAEKEHLDVTVLKAAIEPATGLLCKVLQVAEDDRLVVVERLISHRGQPFTIQVGYAIFNPESPTVEAMLDAETLTGLFFDNGPSSFMKGELRLLPTFFSKEEAKLLHGKAGESVFKIEHIYYDFANQPVSYGWFIVSPEKMPLVCRMGVWNE